MFIVTLRFSHNREATASYMQAHNDWLQQGFDRDILLLAGSILPADGGVLIANNVSRDDLQAFLAQDPFVARNVVTTAIMEVRLSKVHQKLDYLTTEI